MAMLSNYLAAACAAIALLNGAVALLAIQFPIQSAIQKNVLLIMGSHLFTDSLTHLESR
jgi:hypothetical protein